VVGSADAVPGPSWAQAPDPFADDGARADGLDHPHDAASLPDETPAHDDHPTFVDALRADYTATWTADPADHNPPVRDAATSDLLAQLAPQPGGGVDDVLLGESRQSPASHAAELWHESLPDEPLPIDQNGHVLGPVGLLNELIERVDDPAQADVARAVRESLTP
jgi:hypothetical protein